MSHSLVMLAQCSLDCDKPIGTLESVRRIIDRFFPGTTWENSGSGTWESESGTIDFNLGCNPVDIVNIDIHGRVSSLPLVAMAHDTGWCVMDCSSGEDIRNEYDFSNSEIEQEVLLSTSRKKSPKSPSLPRVKERGMFIEHHEPEFLPYTRLVLLRDLETTKHVWNDYGRFCEVNDLFRTTNRHPMIEGNSECVLPDGQRAAIFIYSRYSLPASFEILKQFAVSTDRAVLSFSGSNVVLPNGDIVQAADCGWVNRAKSQ